VSPTDGTHQLGPTTTKKKLVSRTTIDPGFVRPCLMEGGARWRII